MKQNFSTNIDIDYFTNHIAVGGNGGTEFYIGLDKGKKPSTSTVVRSIQAWYNEKTVTGIEIGLTDDSEKKLAGNKAGTATEVFYFVDGETITSLKMWSTDHDHGRMGRFEIHTSNDHTFTCDAPLTGDPYQPDLGSGILVGVFGRSGLEVDCLGFGLLRKIATAVLTDVTYPDLTLTGDEAKHTKIPTAPKEIRTITYDNKAGNVAQSFTFSGSETIETSEAWSITGSLEASVTATVEAGIPLLGSGSISGTLTASVSGTYGRSDTQTSQQSYEFPITVPARKSIKARATLLEGNISTPYTATITYTLDSGRSFFYEGRGIYSGLSVSEVDVTTQTMK